MNYSGSEGDWDGSVVRLAAPQISVRSTFQKEIQVRRKIEKGKFCNGVGLADYSDLADWLWELF